jgi:hypothetical protein
MTRRGRFGPRQGQSMTRIGRRGGGAPELTSRFWQMSVGRRLPRPRSLSALIATQSESKKSYNLKTPPLLRKSPLFGRRTHRRVAQSG